MEIQALTHTVIRSIFGVLLATLIMATSVDGAERPTSAEVSPQRSKTAESLIASISKETLWRNRDGRSRTWFHPRVCMVPDTDNKPIALMTLQEIDGSDYFGQVHWSVSKDQGRTWTAPKPIPAFGREPVPGHEGLKAAVCDVTPQYHVQSKRVIALGHVVFYKGSYFARDEQLPRYPIYALRTCASGISHNRG
jgi:hypothetical protein